MPAELISRSDFDRAALEALANRVAEGHPIIEVHELAELGFPKADTPERLAAWAELGLRFAIRPSDGATVCRADDVLTVVARLANPNALVFPTPPSLLERSGGPH